jgi:SAM-dependent methyltransferase
VEDGLFSGLMLWVCHGCLTHFAVPPPSDQDLVRYYSQAYRSDGRNSTAGAGFPADHPWYLSRALAVAHLVRHAITGWTNSPQPLRVLDIGAGYGHALFALGRVLGRPLDITGVEPDPSCHLTLSTAAGRVIREDFRAALAHGLVPDDLDIALALHVVEHVSTPRGLLASIHARMSPGAVLVVEVPHCPEIRVRWYNVGTPHVPHLVFFTLRGLLLLLTRSGFEVASIDSYGPTFDEKGSYNAEFARQPTSVSGALARGEVPPLPFPLFAEAGSNRLFLRAVGRVPAKMTGRTPLRVGVTADQSEP